MSGWFFDLLWTVVMLAFGGSIFWTFWKRRESTESEERAGVRKDIIVSLLMDREDEVAESLLLRAMEGPRSEVMAYEEVERFVGNNSFSEVLACLPSVPVGIAKAIRSSLLNRLVDWAVIVGLLDLETKLVEFDREASQNSSVDQTALQDILSHPQFSTYPSEPMLKFFQNLRESLTKEVWDNLEGIPDSIHLTFTILDE